MNAPLIGAVIGWTLGFFVCWAALYFAGLLRTRQEWARRHDKTLINRSTR